MTEIINLIWTPLAPISNIKNPIVPNRGIYCWGFTIDNKFMPYYIGVAENISHRIFEHINSIIGGKYTLFHKNDLLNFAEYKNQKETSNKGKLYTPDWPKGYKKFIVNRNGLKEHIDYMIDHFTFSYAVVNTADCSKKDLGEIEKICIEKIDKNNLINTRGGHSSRFKIVHAGDLNLTQFFK